MPGIFDRIKDTTTYSGLLSVGTSFTVTNTPAPIYQSFRSRYAINDANIPVAIVSQTSNNWMICWCTYTALDTLRVDQIIFTSNTVTPDNPVTFSGTSDVFVTASSRAVAGLREANTFTANNYFSSGNVGIGTTNPLKKLDISGGGFAFTDAGGASRSIHWGDTTNIYPVLISGAAASGTGTLTFSTNTFGNAGVERMRIDSLGNVGIGTSSPATPLHVVSAANFQPQIIADHVAGAGTGAAYFVLDRARGTPSARTAVVSGDTLGTLMARGHDGSALQNSAWLSFDVDGAVSAGNVPTGITFFTTPVGGSSAARMHVDADGNVGIGTTGPSDRLVVFGTSSPAIRTQDSTSFTQLYTNGGTGVLNNAGTGSLQLWNNGAERVRIDTNGVLMVNTTALGGLTGLGGLSFRAALNGDMMLGTLARNAAADRHIGVFTTNDPTSDDRARITFQTVAGASSSNSRILFSTNSYGVSGGERVRIDEIGNVGIGTTGPSAPLHVERNQAAETAFFINNTNASGYSAVRIGPSDRGTNFDMLIYSSTTASGIRAGNRPLLFESGAGTERMRMDVNGNFGIGTGSPSSYDAKLAVFNGNFALTTTTNRLYLYYATATNHAYLSTAAGGEILFANGTATPSEKVRIDTIGNVGIGTTAPFCRLHVRNDVTGAAPATSGTVDAATLDRIHNNVVALDTGVMANGNIWLQGRNTGNFATSYPILLNPNPGTGITGALGFGTTAPRSIAHFVTGSAGQYYLFQNTSGAGGTALTSTDTYPIISGNGFIGYGGLFLLPGRWGNATTVDSHNVLYMSGAQRNNAATNADIAFANWGYFTGTTTAAGHLGNATAQADAVKFNIRHTDNGGEFTQRLLFIARSASGTTVNALTILSSGESIISDVGPTDVNAVGFRGSPNNDRSAAYTIALTDAGRTVRKGGTTAFLVSVPADSATNFPIGTCIILCNAEPTSGNLTVQSTNTTTAIVYRNGTGRESRTSANTAYAIAPGGSAMIRKVKADMWSLTGSGIS